MSTATVAAEPADEGAARALHRRGLHLGAHVTWSRPWDLWTVTTGTLQDLRPDHHDGYEAYVRVDHTAVQAVVPLPDLQPV